MNDLIRVAHGLQLFCAEKAWRCCLIGGMAVLRWGQVRATKDVDLSLLTGFGREEDYCEALLTLYLPRIPDAVEFARMKRVLLLKTTDGVGVDVSLAALPVEERIIERASLYEYSPGVKLRTCSAEDLIVLKLFASRPLDIRDAETVAIRHGKTLNWTLIEEELRPLVELKEEPEILDHLPRLRRL